MLNNTHMYYHVRFDSSHKRCWELGCDGGHDGCGERKVERPSNEGPAASTYVITLQICVLDWRQINYVHAGSPKWPVALYVIIQFVCAS